MPDDDLDAVYPPPETFRDATGRLVKCRFIPGPDQTPEPGSLFRTRTLLRADSPLNEEVLQRRLTNAGQPGNWEQADMLDNEIRVGLHLVRLFGHHDGYPAELSRLVGYDIDADEPFVLLLPYRGEPVRRLAGRLKLDQERSFEAGLFQTIRLLEIAELVHGRISPQTVHWDGVTATVQLIDFSRATRTGDPRRRTGQRPWSAAEQVSGSGTADPGDDAWSVGQLVYHVTTGRPVDPNGTLPDLSVRGAALQTLLAGVFAADAAARPRGAELLSRLKVPDAWADGASAVDPRFAEGQRLFEERLAAKFPPPPPPRTAPPHSPPSGKTRRPLRGWFTGAAIAAAIVTVFVVVVFFAGML